MAFAVQQVVSTLDASYARLQGCSGQDMNHGHSHLIPIAFDSRQDPVSSLHVFGALGSSSPQAQAVCLPFDTTQITSAENRSQPQYGDPCHPLAAQGHPPAVCVTGDVTHTLKAEGFDASEDGTGRGQPIVAFSENQRAEVMLSDHLRCMSTGGGKPGQGYPAALVGMQVRRLTPRECERLQGFPDDYTLVQVRGKRAADGPRYKALGNSMAVPVMAHIGRQIDFAMLFDCSSSADPDNCADLFA